MMNVAGMFKGEKNATIVIPKKRKQKTQEEKYRQHKSANEFLPNMGDLKHAVKLPHNENVNEWIAVHTVDFFNQINLLFSSISQFCTKEECPVMSAGPDFEYLWADGVKVKKPMKVSAPEYVELLLSWVQEHLDDEKMFPVLPEQVFPPDFIATVKNIFKRLVRVYAHIYYSHYEEICALEEEPHLNTCFMHFFFFIREFNLVDKKDFEPLQQLIENLTKELDRLLVANPPTLEL
eukprot:TRINITY_DN3624_c0_g1_i3.p1 TRINITY_DN3624_c0_g1~~TRINITY_DN3624_c0_g1_i3.p1  ORF type:complete len:235 (+),score=41.84 TRINITY_DN3624_c0_g1_i3:206-910(+)